MYALEQRICFAEDLQEFRLRNIRSGRAAVSVDSNTCCIPSRVAGHRKRPLPRFYARGYCYLPVLRFGERRSLAFAFVYTWPVDV